MAKSFKDWNLKDIIAYCKEHNETEWLKATAKKKVAVKVYPRIQVVKVKEDGTEYLASVADKSVKPKTEMRRISFVQLKTEFLEKFDLLPKTVKEPDMYDIIDAL